MVQATKKSVTAESGSTSTPTRNHSSAVGSQLTIEVKGWSPRCSTCKARKKTTMLPSQESKAAPTAIVWLRALLRFVKRTIRKNARSGGKGRSQIIDSFFMNIFALPLQKVDLVGGDGIAATVDRDHQCKANGDFRSGHRKDHERERLTGDPFRC